MEKGRLFGETVDVASFDRVEIVTKPKWKTKKLYKMKTITSGCVCVYRCVWVCVHRCARVDVCMCLHKCVLFRRILH